MTAEISKSTVCLCSINKGGILIKSWNMLLHLLDYLYITLERYKRLLNAANFHDLNINAPLFIEHTVNVLYEL